MKTLLISDLHLGSPLFKTTPSFLRLISSHKKIILVGDIIDSWECKIEKIIENNKTLINILKSKELVIIKGNHDPSIEILSKIFNCGIYLDYELGGFKIIHGDQFDELILKYSSVGRFLFAFQWITERLGLNIKAVARETYNSIAIRRGKTYYNDLALEVDKTAIDTYKSHYKGLIMGHTHKPVRIDIDNFTYINIGDMIHNRTYALYDGSSNTWELRCL